MKKNIISIMLAFAVLFMTQCKKQTESQVSENIGKTMEVTLRVENKVDKTTISSTGIVNWKLGDKLYVVGSEQGFLGYLSAVDENEILADFKGWITPITSEQVLHFYYVGDQVFSLDASGNYTFDISVQDGTLAGIAAHNQLMYGKTLQPVQAGTCDFGVILMESLIAVVHMNISFNGAAVSPIALSGCYATSTFNAKEYDGTTAIPGTAGNINMTFTSPAESTDCYLALLPGTQTLHLVGEGCEAGVSEKDVKANAFYNGGDNALEVTMRIPSDVYGMTDGHSWINFNDRPGEEFGVVGLPLWALFNVGVNENDLDEAEDWYGQLYAWGETAGYMEPMVGEGAPCHGSNYIPGNLKEKFTWEYYKWGNGTLLGLGDWEFEIGKYNLDDGMRTLVPDDDVASVKWSSTWRMPHEIHPEFHEWDELVKNTYWKWEYDYNGIEGLRGFVVYKVKSAADKGLMTLDNNFDDDPDPDPDELVWGTFKYNSDDWEEVDLTGEYDYSTDYHMFLPATKHVNDQTALYGDYWSGTGSVGTQYGTGEERSEGAYTWAFFSAYGSSCSIEFRSGGKSVRPVIGSQH